MTHIDHDAVDPELTLIVRDDPDDTVPERTVDMFRRGQARVVHPDGVVADVVEVRVRVHPEIRDITPRWLVVVRRPIGEGAGDPHPRPVVQRPDIAPVFFLHVLRPRRLSEEIAMHLMRGDQVASLPLLTS